MPAKSVGNTLEDVLVILGQGRDIGADTGKGSCSFECAETAGNFLLDLAHAQILLGEIVRKWDAEVVEEGENAISMEFKPVEKILSLGLLWTSAPFFLGRRKWRVSCAPLGNESIITLTPSRELLGRKALDACRLLLFDKPAHFQEQVMQLTCPRLVELLEDEGQFAQ